MLGICVSIAHFCQHFFCVKLISKSGGGWREKQRYFCKDVSPHLQLPVSFSSTYILITPGHISWVTYCSHQLLKLGNTASLYIDIEPILNMIPSHQNFDLVHQYGKKKVKMYNRIVTDTSSRTQPPSKMGLTICSLYNTFTWIISHELFHTIAEHEETEARRYMA